MNAEHPGHRESGRFRWGDGQEVAWTRRGCGTPVVMCHGTPWSQRLWHPVAESLGAEGSGLAVWTWDMLGYGRSDHGRDLDVSLAVQGEILAALLEEWALERPHVVAHDYGGAVALRAHLLGGASYASLALVDVVALAPWGSEFFRLVKEHAGVFERLPAPMHRALVEAYVRGAAHQPLSDAHLDMLVDPWTGDRQAAFYTQIAQADQRFTDEIEPRYADLDLPVLVVWGTEDTWIPVDRAHRLVATIPGARLVLVPGAGHLVQLDQPELLTGHLSRWLPSAARGAGGGGGGGAC